MSHTRTFRLCWPSRAAGCVFEIPETLFSWTKYFTISRPDDVSDRNVLTLLVRAVVAEASRALTGQSRRQQNERHRREYDEPQPQLRGQHDEPPTMIVAFFKWLSTSVMNWL
jgi:hypothetical protein